MLITGGVVEVRGARSVFMDGGRVICLCEVQIRWGSLNCALGFYVVVLGLLWVYCWL